VEDGPCQAEKQLYLPVSQGDGRVAYLVSLASAAVPSKAAIWKFLRPAVVEAAAASITLEGVAAALMIVEAVVWVSSWLED